MNATIKKLRAQITALQVEGDTLERQPLSAAECAAAALEGAEQAEREFNGRASLALRRIACGYSPAVAMREVFAGPDALALALAGLMGAGAVSDAVLRQLETVPAGLDADARVARLAEIAAELNTLEVAEEAAIEASEAAGAPIERRPDARPEIILGVLT